MMTKMGETGREQVEIISLDELVPAEHIVRKIEAAIDWNFIYEFVEEEAEEIEEIEETEETEEAAADAAFEEDADEDDEAYDEDAAESKRIYCWEGHLMEQYTSDDYDFDPEVGEYICEAIDMRAEFRGNLLAVTLTAPDGTESEVCFALRCAQTNR